MRSIIPIQPIKTRKAWERYKCFYDDFDVYGHETKGKGDSDLPNTGATGYDATKLKDVVTDKGYNAIYDTSTGKVYYTGMVTPDGFGYCDLKSEAAVDKYLESQGIDVEAEAGNGGTSYAATYEQKQAALGTYNGD